MPSVRVSSADSSAVSVSNKGISLGLSSSGTSPSNVIVSSVPVKNHTFRGLSPIGDVTSLFRDVLGPLTAVRRQSPTVQVAAGAGGGIIAGYVFGKTSKMVAILLGSTVLFLQFAQCKGYLQIQNGKLREDFEAARDKLGEMIDGMGAIGGEAVVEMIEGTDGRNSGKEFFKIVSDSAHFLCGIVGGILVGFGMS